MATPAGLGERSVSLPISASSRDDAREPAPREGGLVHRPSTAFTARRTSESRLSIRASGGAHDGSSRPKEPVLQLFVMPVDVPHRCGMRVVCSSVIDGADGGAPGGGTGVDEVLLGATRPSDKRDHLFSDPIELWDEASGRQASVPLVFRVKARRERQGSPLPHEGASASSSTADGDEEETLACARIGSDQLRSFGLYNPREGAAIALPLLAPDGTPLARGCALHCYVYVGYSSRPRRASSAAFVGAASAAAAAVAAASAGAAAAPASTNGVAGGKPVSRMASAEAVAAQSPADAPPAGGAQPPPLHIEYALTPSSSPLEVLLRVRGRNTSRRHALRLDSVDLKPPPSWEVATLRPDAASLLCGMAVPPHGRFEMTFALEYIGRRAPEAPALQNGGTASAPAASSDPTADGGAGAACAILEMACCPCNLDGATGELAIDVTDPTGRGGEAATTQQQQQQQQQQQLQQPTMAMARIPLTPPAARAPVVIASHTFSHSPLRVGTPVTLDATLAWPALLVAAPPSGASSWLVEVEVVSTSNDWIILGNQRQRLRLSFEPGAATTTQLRWTLVPLSIGHVQLPCVHVIRLNEPPSQGAGAAVTALPLVPYLGGATAFVEQTGVQSSAGGHN